MKRLHLIIHGRVQKVGFRFFTSRSANKLGLTGFVRNLPDKTVEAVAEGEEDTLKQLLEYCREGPWFANVVKVDEKWSDFKGDFKDFKVQYF
ncbi:MAG: acylphosphatase [archaeon]